ncbi:bifunctional ADP-dependent NAD(P)H-hydrate dehydratase/NAD(P)H-hydrate epimerase [Anaerocolumna xylanovorans]|uniref:Bifunctional NAD(P)H-hydrate repair enzyme n=1 Tax=Anaerocolumna xylanovorans DSM 12503 TaxID=1121345 RepID=A0A1M7YEN6_9FIRM|nr:bifunctional ADP-dependent NAD(P)H-hydrate dehydratase/NAD(P)H-hydrate epimerase [Anaerocolumna xylanovorans]SHO51097.1 NAD(P)H-hydrate epimerase [Anaerocolumna xylanovorans DSM 12503]
MKYLVSSGEMKEIDKKTIEDMGIPAIVLMERAALKVAEAVEEYIKASESVYKTNKVLVICGTGNNGADGIAAARILSCKGHDVKIHVIGDKKSASALFCQQSEIAVNFGVPMISNLNSAEYTIDESTILIDAIFGVGLNREVTGIYKDIIDKINFSAKRKVFSVDIPSGLSGDSGFPMGTAVIADSTITFGYQKIGMVMYPGCNYAGEVTVEDIGFAGEEKLGINLKYFTYEKEDLKLLPCRRAYSNKGSYGKVLVIAGSANMSGAAYFSAKAAYKTGAGLVKIMTNEKNRISLQTALPEALLCTYPDGELTKPQLDALKEELAWADVLVIGPGIGRKKEAEKLLELVLENVNVPLIIDGDAIWLLGQRINALQKEQDFSPGDLKREEVLLFGRIRYLKSILPDKAIITPHLKELSYLLAVSVERIQQELLKTANQCMEENHMIYAIKDARTVVAFAGKQYINMSGNNGMATGGSGDVLTGVIAGLIAGGLEEYTAAALGVYVHGLAGDFACEELGEYSLMATDISDYISKVMSRK